MYYIIDGRTDLFDCSMDSLGDNDDDSIALAKLYYKSNIINIMHSFKLNTCNLTLS